MSCICGGVTYEYAPHQLVLYIPMTETQVVNPDALSAVFNAVIYFAASISKEHLLNLFTEALAPFEECANE